jgi:CRP-like cAMP-binding protein
MNSFQAAQTPAVVDVEQKAKQVLASVYQLQPQINIRGMEPEAETLQEMKGDLVDLVEMVKSLTLTNSRLARVVGSCREDAVSSLLELKKQLICVETREMTDEMLHKASLTAEAFAVRCQDYLASKAQLKTLL